MDTSFNHLTEVILSKRNVHDKGVTVIKAEHQEQFISYHDIIQKSLIITGTLQQLGVKIKDEIVIQTEDVEQFIYSYWACILGGFIPVPLSTGGNKEHRLKILNVWSTLNRPYFLSNEKNIQRLKRFINKSSLTSEFNQILTSTITIETTLDNVNKGTIYEPDPDDLAMIQFSSGSTGKPKGVTLSHRNICTNIKDIMVVDDMIQPNDKFISWLPLTHDFGLIVLHLLPFAANLNHMIMPTQLFIMSPFIWLRKISEYRATCIASPNFGYQYLLNFFQDTRIQNNKFDLSSVRCIFNSAEQISPTVVQSFIEKLKPYQLKDNRMITAYGLAEASVAVTVGEKGKPLKTYTLSRNHLNIGEAVREVSKNGLDLVDLGKPLPSIQLRVCDDQDNELGEDRIGHIQIKGLNVTKGYYNNPKSNQSLYTHDGYLRTGDIGFIRKGNLVLSGRNKDLIIINGNNIFPYDIERIAEQIEGIELNAFACTGVYNEETGQEEAIGFLLRRSSPAHTLRLMEEIEWHVKDQMGITLKHIIPVKSIPKTTSGKIQRFQLANQFQMGVYDENMKEIKEIKQNHSVLK